DSAKIAMPNQDAVSLVAQATFVAVGLGIPMAGYAVMYFDFRRWLRSLQRAMVVVKQYTRRANPYVPRDARPPCLVSLDLQIGCTEEQVMIAYRRKVMHCHPDRGGSIDDFLQLQRHFEQAMYLARNPG
ncbi:MAG: hypothetical protein KDA61_09425, partial [Planctomycetales bacterium]|nr:hypothetical protein [Planctomycetales bacterium]